MSLHPSNHVCLCTKHRLSWHFPRHDLHQHYPHAVDIALLSRLQRDLGEPEITQMCFHVGIQQHITGLNISVDDGRNTIMMKSQTLPFSMYSYINRFNPSALLLQ